MFCRTSLTVALLVSAASALPTFAQFQQRQQQAPQDQPAPTTQQADQQELQDAMRAMFMQIFQRISQRGEDAQQLFAGMRDGSMDMSEMQQMLVDKGLVDKEQIAHIQEIAQRGLMRQIREQLSVTDDEWSALQPKIQRVLDANASLGGNMMNAPSRGGMQQALANNRGATSDASKAFRSLRNALKDPNTPPEEVTNKLELYRQAHERALLQLQAAQKDLTEVLSVAQEAALVNMGILQ
jgi:hypothetical protein